MQRSLSILTATALGLGLAWPALGQETAPLEEPAETGAPLAPAPETPGAGAPTPEAPTEAPAEDEAPAEAATPSTDAAEPGPATETMPAEDETPDAELPGAPAVPAPMAGQEAEEVTIRESFGEWDVRCAEATEECALHQLGLDEDDNPVVEFSLFRVPEGDEAAALVNILSPLGTFLPAGITMQVDAGEARQYGFTFCTGIGCVAQIALTEQTVAAMRRGRSATLALASIAAPEEPVEIELSLIGFTDAWNSLAPAE